MAPKRKQKRIPRRINVRFREKGEDEYAVGYTKNVSVGGLFIGTIRPLPPGTEIVVEIKEANEVRQRLATVVHAARVSPLLASVRTSGMGVRFLDRQEEATDLTAEVEEVTVGLESEPAELEETAKDPGDEQGEAPADLRINLTDVERFREAFRRDIQHGLIFVPAPIGAAVGDELKAGILVPGGGGEIKLRARVDRETICRSEAYGELGVAGFMLVFLEGDRSVSRLRAFL